MKPNISKKKLKEMRKRIYRMTRVPSFNIYRLLYAQEMMIKNILENNDTLKEDSTPVRRNNITESDNNDERGRLIAVTSDTLIKMGLADKLCTAPFVKLGYAVPQKGDFYLTGTGPGITEVANEDFGGSKKYQIVAPSALSYYDYLVSEESGLRLRAWTTGDGDIYVVSNKMGYDTLPYCWKKKGKTFPNNITGAVLDTLDIKIIPYEVFMCNDMNIRRWYE